MQGRKKHYVLIILVVMQLTEYQPTEEDPGVKVDTKLRINQQCVSTMTKAMLWEC